MIYLALLGGIAVAAYSMIVGFFVVGAKSKSVLQESLAFGGPLTCAALVGFLFRLPAKFDGPEWLAIPASAFCSGFAVLLTALPRVIYRSFRGEPFRIAFLFRFSAYSAVVALIASVETLRPHLLQLTIATSLFCSLFYLVFAISYQRFLNPKSNLILLYFPLNYIAVLCLLLVTQGIEGASRILSNFGWLEHIMMLAFPLSYLFIWACSFGMKQFMIQERESWFIEKHLRRRPEDLKDS